MMNAVDLSNYSGALTAAQVQGLTDAGIVLAIVQSVDPPAGYPDGVTRQQIEALADGVMVVDAYIWIWFDLPISDIRYKLALLNGLPIRRVWLDVEDIATQHLDQIVCEARVAAALAECDAFPTTSGLRAGIYTGRWFWAAGAYMSNSTQFADRDLWDANYDGVDDAAAGFVPYGGWDHATIKQFKGTSTLAGVPNVDLNALSDIELARVTGEPVPDPVCQPYRDALERVVNRIQIEDERKTAAGKPAAIRRTVLREIAAEAFEAYTH